MNCEEARSKIISFVEGDLDKEDHKLLEKHFNECAGCMKELEAVRSMIGNISVLPIPEPSVKMQSNFDTMLTEYKRELRKVEPNWASNLQETLSAFLSQFYLGRIVYAVIFLAIGWAIGTWSNKVDPHDDKLTAMSEEIKEMRTMMMLTLLEQPSASERLRAVSFTDELPTIDEKVIDALLKTLNNDPNVNVRLVTVEALMNYSNDSRVRSGIITSLSTQDSPMVQAELIDAINTLQEKSAVAELEMLLKDQKLNAMVREKAKKSIEILL